MVFHNLFGAVGTEDYCHWLGKLLPLRGKMGWHIINEREEPEVTSL